MLSFEQRWGTAQRGVGFLLTLIGEAYGRQYASISCCKLLSSKADVDAFVPAGMMLRLIYVMINNLFAGKVSTRAG